MRSLAPSRCYYIIYWRNKALTVLYEWTLAFWKIFLDFGVKWWFLVAVLICIGSTKYKVCLIFIIAYLDEFKPSFSGGGGTYGSLPFSGAQKQKLLPCLLFAVMVLGLRIMPILNHKWNLFSAVTLKLRLEAFCFLFVCVQGAYVGLLC